MIVPCGVKKTVFVSCFMFTFHESLYSRAGLWITNPRKEGWKGTIFPPNFVYVLRTITARHMVSFINIYFHLVSQISRPNLRLICSLYLPMWHTHWAWVTVTGDSHRCEVPLSLLEEKRALDRKVGDEAWVRKRSGQMSGMLKWGLNEKKTGGLRERDWNGHILGSRASISSSRIKGRT